MFSYFQAIVIGAVQGMAELFPISSLGHSVILEGFLNWQMKETNPYFLTFLVATHAATATVLFIVFWKDWKKIIGGIFRSLKNREIAKDDGDAKLGWLLVVATIPAGILGVLFQTQLQALFSQPQLVAGILILNGIMLLMAEKLRKQAGNKKITALSWGQSIKVGILQCLALLPGFSRTGSTITGGLLAGLSHEEAARFSFLLATPIIAAAAVLKLPDLATPGGQIVRGPIVAGAVTAAVTSFLSVKFLEKYFQTEKLTPFGIYCISAGILASIAFLFR